jgi:hypothetical protein
LDEQTTQAENRTRSKGDLNTGLAAENQALPTAWTLSSFSQVSLSHLLYILLSEVTLQADVLSLQLLWSF